MYHQQAIYEALMLGTEFFKVPDTDALRVALESQKQKDIDEAVAALKEAGQKFFNKDYNPEVDRKVSKQLIALYAQLIPANQRIDIFQTIEKDFQGNTDAFVDACFNQSIFRSPEALDEFLKQPDAQQLENDLMVRYAASVRNGYQATSDAMQEETNAYNAAHKTWVEGVLQMKKANGQVSFTLQPGAITDLDSFVKENKIVKILLLPINIINRVAKVLNIDLFPAEKSAQKGQISYDAAEGVYNFVNGVMTVEKTTLTSKLTNINGSGKVDFPQDNIDMKVSATVLTSQTPIVIKITGPVENPSGKLDVLNTVGSLVGGLLSTQTPGNLVSGAASTAGAVATGAVKTTGKVAETAVKTGTTVVKGTVGVASDTVKGTVNTAKDALKSIGSLFKKSDGEEETKK